MKTYFVYCLTGILCVSLLSSCKKQLQEKGFSSLDATIFPKTEGDLRVLCNGMYINMQQYEGYGRSYYIMSDVFSDEAYSARPNGPRYEIENFLITPSNTEVDNWWTRSYLIIGMANTIVELAPTVPIPQDKALPYVAEAKFIRAMTYFQMLRFFGDVPLILTQSKNVDSLKNFKPARTPQQDVYKQVVDDLIFAEANLPREADIPANYKGIPSTGAASSLLAKVYLTRAYLPFADANDFQSAADECGKVIGSGDYDLFPNYADVFDVFKKNGIEHIFSIQFDLLPNESNAIVSFLSPPEVYPLGFASFPAERKFYDEFPDGDAIRKAFAFYSTGIGFAGTPYDYISDPTSNPYCAKWRDPEVLNSNNDRTNYIFLRFADVLLMQSEALNQIDAGDPNKYNGINRVRARVNLSPVSGIPDGADFADTVLNERHWELCFEGQRRHDLIRMGKLEQVMNALGKTNIRPYHKYYPVPQPEIDLNPNLSQNEGY